MTPGSLKALRALAHEIADLIAESASEDAPALIEMGLRRAIAIEALSDLRRALLADSPTGPALTFRCVDDCHVFVSPDKKGRCACGRWLIAVAAREAKGPAEQCEEVGVDPYRCTLLKGHKGSHETDWSKRAPAEGAGLRERAAALKPKIETALQMVFHVCKNPPRNWRMTVPVQKTDSDTVLCDALESAEKLCDALLAHADTPTRQEKARPVHCNQCGGYKCPDAPEWQFYARCTCFSAAQNAVEIGLYPQDATAASSVLGDTCPRCGGQLEHHEGLEREYPSCPHCRIELARALQ